MYVYICTTKEKKRKEQKKKRNKEKKYMREATIDRSLLL